MKIKIKEALIIGLSFIFQFFSLLMILNLNLPSAERLLLISSNLFLTIFLLCNALEDLRTRLISRGRNVIFILCSSGFSLFRMFYIHKAQGDWETYASVWIVTMLFMFLMIILVPRDKFGLGDTLSCLGTVNCLLAMFGTFGIMVFFLVILIAGFSALINCAVKREQKTAFLPHLLIGSLASVSVILTATGILCR